jgi:hypothetical protein
MGRAIALHGKPTGLNFTQGPFPSLIFRPDNFSYAIEPAYYVLLLAWVHFSDKNSDV